MIMHDFFEISSLDVHSNTYINSYSGTHTCSHVYMHIMHIFLKWNLFLKCKTSPEFLGLRSNKEFKVRALSM